MSDTTYQTPPRVRINAKQTAKGEWQLDVTGEAGGPEEASEMLRRAMELARREVEQTGGRVVGS